MDCFTLVAANKMTLGSMFLLDILTDICLKKSYSKPLIFKRIETVILFVTIAPASGLNWLGVKTPAGPMTIFRTVCIQDQHLKGLGS